MIKKKQSKQMNEYKKQYKIKIITRGRKERKKTSREEKNEEARSGGNREADKLQRMNKRRRQMDGKRN